MTPRLVMRIEPTADYPHGTRLPTPEDLRNDPAVQALIAEAVRREREAVVAYLHIRAAQYDDHHDTAGWMVQDRFNDAIRSVELCIHHPTPTLKGSP